MMFFNSNFRKIGWRRFMFLLTMLFFTTPILYSKEVHLSAEEEKILKKLRITPATKWIEAHDFKAELMDATTVNLKDYRGRFVLLNFWASWCSPCLKEMPDFEKAYVDMGNENMVVLAVGMGESIEKIQVFLKKYSFSFPLLADDNMQITKLYGVKNIPVTYIIDPDGLVLGRALGIRDWANSDFLKFMKDRLR